jgi:hypothetical protein
MNTPQLAARVRRHIFTGTMKISINGSQFHVTSAEISFFVQANAVRWCNLGKAA